jgi:amidase
MIFAHHDLMLLPTTPGRSPLLGQPANTMATYREDLMSLTAIAGLTGRPQIHLPLFNIEGAPCGLSLIGNKNSDLLLITMARELIKQSETSTKAKHTL